MSIYISDLTLALGNDRAAPGRWYENRSNEISPAPDSAPFPEITTILEDAGVEQQHTSSKFEKLQLNPYKTNAVFTPHDPVSFLDEHQNPSMLHTLLSETVVREGWEQPWTNDETVKHKMNLRLELPSSLDQGVPEQSANTLFYVLDHRKDQKPVTKTKLGYNIAKALKECEKLTVFCKLKGYEFDNLALYDLVRVSQGSWQPTLYVKVAD